MVRKQPGHRKNTYVYKCTRCGEMPAPGDNFTSRDLLVQKKIIFGTIGQFYRPIKTRTVDWLCPACLEKDEDWNRPAGAKRPKINEVEDLEEYLMLTDPTGGGGAYSADRPKDNEA